MSLNIGILESARNIDIDAQAFFNRVTAAGGTLSGTEKSAVNTLVLCLKASGNWARMKAIYPMVGGSNASCRQNLKSSSFTGTFSGGWTFSSNGATPNGTTGYMNTGFGLITGSVNKDNVHLSYYSRTQILESSSEIGSSNNFDNQYSIDFYFQSVSRKLFVAGIYPTLAASSTNNDTLGFIIGSRTSSTSAKVYMDGVLLATNTNSNNKNFSDFPMYLGGHNKSGTFVEPSSKQCAFASIGEGLSDIQASSFYNCVQAFQTSLSRQV